MNIKNQKWCSDSGFEVFQTLDFQIRDIQLGKSMQIFQNFKKIQNLQHFSSQTIWIRHIQSLVRKRKWSVVYRVHINIEDRIQFRLSKGSLWGAGCISWKISTTFFLINLPHLNSDLQTFALFPQSGQSTAIPFFLFLSYLSSYVLFLRFGIMESVIFLKTEILANIRYLYVDEP